MYEALRDLESAVVVVEGSDFRLVKQCGLQHTSVHVSTRQHTSAYGSDFMLVQQSGLQHTSSSYVIIRQQTSAFASRRQHKSADVRVSIRQHTSESAYVSIRQHPSAYVRVSIRQHTSAYVSMYADVC